MQRTIASITIALIIVLGVLGGATQPSCGARQTAPAALLNCTGEQLGTTPGLNLETAVAVAALVAQANDACRPSGGGPLDWTCVGGVALGRGLLITGCTLAELAGPLVAPQPGLAAATTPPPDQVRAAREALEAFRREHGVAAIATSRGFL